MAKNVDWIAIEGAYRAGKTPVLRIAAEHGISEGLIRKKAKQLGWTRDPSGAKREIVAAAMAGITQEGTNSAIRTINAEAEQDISDMGAGLAVARACILKLSVLVHAAQDAKDIKTIVEANAGAIATIRKIRGLDDPQTGNGETQVTFQFTDA